MKQPLVWAVMLGLSLGAAACQERSATGQRSDDTTGYDTLCTSNCGCTRTLGFWKTHCRTASTTGRHLEWPPIPGFSSPPEDALLCGKKLLAILETAPGGIKWYQLAQQWIPAKLNVSAGAAPPTDVQAALGIAESLLRGNCLAASLPSAWSGAHSTLNAFNEGTIGPGHCGSNTHNCNQPCAPPGDCQQAGVCASSTGQCTYKPKLDGTTCASDGKACTRDACVQGACIHAAAPMAGTVCRAKDGACDVAETCDGQSADCPVDKVSTTEIVCRASVGKCDVAEHCDGAHKSCPADKIAANTAVCRPAAKVCDAPELCDGTNTACPVDKPLSDGTRCEDDGDDCKGINTCVAGVCLQTTPPTDCPAPDVCHREGTCVAPGQCSASVLKEGYCFINGSCVANGAGSSTNPCVYCNANNPGSWTPKALGTRCNDDGDDCNGINACVAGACAQTTPPRSCSAADECHEAAACVAGQCGTPVLKSGYCFIEGHCVAGGTAANTNSCQYCNPQTPSVWTAKGDNQNCTEDGNPCTTDRCQQGQCVHAAGNPGAVCRVAKNQCDVAETCDGVSSVCPTDGFKSAGTACEDGDECTVEDTCVNGVCVGGANTCSDCDDFGIAKGYSLFVAGGAYGCQSDIEGRVGVGGDAVFSSYSIGSKLPVGTDALMVGGNASFRNGTLYGNLVYGGTQSVASVDVRGATRQASPINFVSEFEKLRALSAALCARPANGEAVGNLTLVGHATEPVSYFTVQALAGIGYLTIDMSQAPQGAPAIINVQADGDVAFSGFETALVGTDSNRVLYNFCNATSLSISNVPVRGTLLAPASAIGVFQSAQVNGAIIGASYGAPSTCLGGEIHAYFFAACVPK